MRGPSERPKWEVVRGRFGRLRKAEVGGRERPKWEAKVGGQIGRPKWEAMRGCERPNLEAM